MSEPSKPIRIHPIPAFSDNYIWLLSNADGDAVVVDPGQAQPVLNHLARHDQRLCGILITHHHHDHIGGIAELRKVLQGPVYGPEDPRIGDQHVTVGEGDVVKLPELNLDLEVLEVPGHTISHVAYVNPELAFVGDTLFSVGCGRLFEGSPAQMHSSLQRLAQLPAATRLYCTHEYTASNCAFALQVEPGNPHLQARISEVNTLRAANQPSLPTILADELKTNPFLRCSEPAVRESAARRAGNKVRRMSDVDVFAELRAWKDVA